MKQKYLEVQLMEAKLAQQTVVAAEEKEISLQERQQVRLKCGPFTHTHNRTHN